MGVLAVVDEGLGNSSYVVDLGDGSAAVVDPSRDPAPYLAVAERLGLRVRFSVETHLHADFVSGSRELAARSARVVVPAEGAVEFPAVGLRDGDELDLGGLTLRALGTPGHTPEHLSYLLVDDGRPVALFSGGSLLVGAVARTDLIAPDRTEELARLLWRSLHERVLTLPDDVAVYPTHGAGSFCSAPAGSQRTTTIGQERAGNPLLRAGDEDAFVRKLLAGLGSYPPYFLQLREVNRRGPTVHGSPPPPLEPLAPGRVAELVDRGAWVVDARPVAGFGREHVAGSVSIPLREAFATWLGWIVPWDASVVLVLDEGQDRSDVVRQALKVGYEQLAGELAGGVAAWRSAGLPTAGVELAVPGRQRGRLVDVRQRAEWDAGHVPGAVHAELGSILHTAVPAGPVTLMCGHGERAMTAASLLARAGRRDVSVLDGGPGDLQRPA